MISMWALSPRLSLKTLMVTFKLKFSMTTGVMPYLRSVSSRIYISWLAPLWKWLCYPGHDFWRCLIFPSYIAYIAPSKVLVLITWWLGVLEISRSSNTILITPPFLSFDDSTAAFTSTFKYKSGSLLDLKHLNYVFLIDSMITLAIIGFHGDYCIN